MHLHRVAALLVALVVVVPAAGARSGQVKVRVSPRTSSADQPVHIRISGLYPRSSAEIRLRVRDASGKLWHSSAVVPVDSRGSVDMDRAPARSGGYAGRWGMGLISSLTTRTSSGVGFSWKSAGGAQAFRIDVRVRGKRVTSRTFFRSIPGRVAEEPVTTSGLYGRFYTPSIGPGSPGRKRTAILVLGGSEGGLPTAPLLAALAAHGYPTLSLAYFRAAGLPQTLENIPLEYFQQALLWLRAQPLVDPNRIVVLGVSFGSQAAQLLGVHYPTLVSAVVASVPSNVATCGIPCSGPAWTFEGRPVPYTRVFNDPSPADNPDAIIPDEQIHGPVFLVCGGLDSAWVSCIYTRAIMSRLAARGHAYRDVSYAFARAGHHVGSLLPYFPVAPRRLYFNQVDEQARAKVWPHLLSFLARL